MGQNNIQSEVERVEELYAAYERLQYEDHQPIMVMKAFHDWYDAASVLFSKYFEGDESYVKFSSVETDGNHYVLSHVFDSIRALYKVMMNKLKSGNVPTGKRSDADESVSSTPYVFVSHASVDDEILQLFKTHILKGGLGLTDEQIAYTSDEASGVPAGDNIPQFIKNGIGKAQVVLFMISEGYKASEVCLNEMGAAWALEKHTISVLLPDVSFKSLGWLTSLDKAIKIDERDKLSNLADVICEKTGIKSPRHATLNQAITNFLTSIEVVGVSTRSNAADVPYLAFEDGTDVHSVEVPFVSKCYVPNPVTKMQNPPDLSTIMAGSVDLAARLSRKATVFHVEPVVNFGIGRKNLSMCEVHLELHNPGKSIENVSVLIKCENLRFDSENISGCTIRKIAQTGRIIKDDGCDFTVGTCNAGMMYSLTKFYVEPTDIYGEIDGYPDESEREYKLQYTISTKDQPYSGELTLKIKPTFEDVEYAYDDSKEGKIIIEKKEISE